jgi:hypothetical protein
MPGLHFETSQGRTGLLRRTLGFLALAGVLVLLLWRVNLYLNHPQGGRPHDFLQVWSAGRLTLQGESPYDARRMLELQLENQSPRKFASMMWVAPWGLLLALPIGAMSIPAAQGVWVLGQLALILGSAIVVWRLAGGRGDRLWIPILLVFSSGPLWWQTAIGQYAGIMMFGIVAYLLAHRAGRPILAGLALTLIALKPHLFLLFATGLVIDALRTSTGRRVVLGGSIGLATGAAIVTLVSPDIWRQYFEAATGEGSPYAPSLKVWFSPTIPAWIRYFVPGNAFWIQFVPAAIACLCFAVYWWRCGNPARWPAVLDWAIPVGLLLAPYGSWPSDLTLLLIPIVGLAARVDQRGWAIPGWSRLAGVYLFTNVSVMLMYMVYNGTAFYVWVAPMLCGCMLWARLGLKPPRSRGEEGSKGLQSFLPTADLPRAVSHPQPAA